MSRFEQVRFKGKDLLMFDDDTLEDAALTTAYRYSNGLPSYAHCFGAEDGVRRWSQGKIGEISEVERLGTFVEVEPSDEAVFGLIDEAVFGLIFTTGWTEDQDPGEDL